MEKWARDFQIIINKRDSLLEELCSLTGRFYTYLSVKGMNENDFESAEEKILFSQLKKSIEDYDQAFIERDQKMFGNFLDSIIHEENPTKESQNWCANQF